MEILIAFICGQNMVGLDLGFPGQKIRVNVTALGAGVVVCSHYGFGPDKNTTVAAS